MWRSYNDAAANIGVPAGVTVESKGSTRVAPRSTVDLTQREGHTLAAITRS